MNSDEFVSAIKTAVRNGAIEGIIDELVKPSGRTVSGQKRVSSELYHSLSEPNKRVLKGIISEAVDDAVFGFFCALDGVRAIEETGEKGELQLIYRKNQEETILNDPDNIYLHDLYQQKCS